ncbi:Cupredoxin superfamily protein [Zea mays]|jgi:L-ascorbate oxidase|uniref:L-ascorbate oxidase n=2 Tax=Zea mays TaxID=4577 RepID=K7URE6_MAIZE|nr:Cupredoxin superfamily protein [Zea mays]
MSAPRQPLCKLATAVHHLLLCSLAALSVSADAKVHHHTWDIAYHYKSLDCVNKLAVTINGESPGPTIRATQGDTVVVTVRNSLETENTGIHWHGIRQVGSPWADGTVGVTQCPILPGDTFTYRFVVDRPGTYFYHAHYGMQRVAGLDGMLVVSVPDGVAEPFAYDEDRTVLLMDWWHKSVYEQAVGLASDPLVFVGEPQSLLINGRGVFEPFHCSRAPSASGCSSAPRPAAGCAPPALFTAVPGKTYRLRVGSLTSLSALNFAIEGHSMTVVEADGHYVRPVVVDSLYIYSGESYSVLLTADQDPSRNYWAASHVVARERNTTSAMAILSYAGNDPRAPPPTPRPEGPAWDDARPRLEQSRSLAVAHPDHVVPVPPRPDRALLLLNTQNRIGGHIRWAINGVSLAFPATPYLVSIKRGLRGAYDDQRPPPDTYDYRSYDIASPPTANGTVASKVYRLALGSVVDVVLQNTVALNNKSETHPWHLHGHDFWVLAYGDDGKKFDPERDTNKFNLRDPVMKNTVALHPRGWTAVRFVADNPGVWLFHCHIEAHVYMGMGLVFEEGVDKVGRLPKSIMGCGRSRT